MASNTDKFIKGARRWSGQIGSGGVADGSTTTIPLTSTTNLPTDTAVELTIDRVDANGNPTPAKEEVVRGVVSGTNIIDCVRGVEGTAQAHSAGAVVEVRLTADQWNRQVDALLVEHEQDGTHKKVLEAIYPVGSVYINRTNSTNPATLFGFGTWVALGAGKVLVGYDSGDADFDTAGETGGSKTVTLTAAQSGLVSHNHSDSGHTHAGNGGFMVPHTGGGSMYRASATGYDGPTPNTDTSYANISSCSSASASQSHSIVQPYIVVYIWYRTA